MPLRSDIEGNTLANWEPKGKGMLRKLVVAMLFIPASVTASSEESDVLAVVQRFFDTMAARDVEGARKIVIPEGRIFSVRVQDGRKVVRSFTNQDFLDGLASREQDVLERMWEPTVTIHQDIAVVWTRYDFHRDGKFSHCGVDAFDVVKTPDGWKISGGTYTVERTGCPESPLGPP